ncbi:hypothetical protein O181_022340 [Austropuccinia psidii MF-1]|uniref:Uncharacterized protein n=1 Tax=Austropuccinia psidii MF-1 TaxID=1389203 RepID=A0A9Q3CH78_9BASI|nr:hypothetical protein [Austropuccinia psidii MF-1]
MQYYLNQDEQEEKLKLLEMIENKEIFLMEINDKHAFQMAEFKFKNTTARNAQIALEESSNNTKLEYEKKKDESEQKNKVDHEIKVSIRTKRLEATTELHKQGMTPEEIHKYL